jgi:hypothetical protein
LNEILAKDELLSDKIVITDDDNKIFISDNLSANLGTVCAIIIYFVLQKFILMFLFSKNQMTV